MARIAIIGPGAIGGVMATWLSQTGDHSIVVCARRALGELSVETPSGKIVAHPSVVTDPLQAPPVDWVLVATKTYDAVGAAAWFPRLRADGAPVAVLQNGTEHRELFAPWVDSDKILPVLLYCPAERTSPTQFRQRRDARVDVPDDSLGRAFADLFRGTRVSITPRADFKTALWRKLGVNAAGVLNALLLQPAGVFQEPGIAELARAITRECIAVARAEGAQLDDRFVEEVLELYHSNPADSINSLHADVVARRPNELEARNGVIVRLGRKHGVATPYNDMAVRLLESLIAHRS